MDPRNTRTTRKLDPNFEIRIPETRTKPEIRRPNAGSAVRWKKCSADRFQNAFFRASDFGFLSDLGFRTSVSGLHFAPFGVFGGPHFGFCVAGSFVLLRSFPECARPRAQKRPSELGLWKCQGPTDAAHGCARGRAHSARHSCAFVSTLLRQSATRRRVRGFTIRRS